MDRYAMLQLVKEMKSEDRARFHEMRDKYMEHYSKARSDAITWGQLFAYRYPEDELIWIDE